LLASNIIAIETESRLGSNHQEAIAKEEEV